MSYRGGWELPERPEEWPGNRANLCERAAYRQVFEPAGECRGDELRIASQLNGFQPWHQFGEEAVDLHAGQRGAQTEMRAVAEGQVFGGVAADVEAERVVEDVPVGLADTYDMHRLAGRDRNAGHGRVFAA